jgi:cysteinyl-tRNA synthetase
MDAGDEAGAELAARTAAVLAAALGLAVRPADVAPDDESLALAAERDAARAARDWARADELRAVLSERGWAVEDGQAGTVLRRR